MRAVSEYGRIPKQRVPCACCGSGRSRTAVVGDRYGFGLETAVCERCGLVFTNPRPSAEWFDAFYRRDYRRYYDGVDAPDESYVSAGWLRPRHERLVDRYLGSLPPTGRLLDVGCAEGTFLDVFRRRYPGWDLVGIEPSEEFASFARSHYGLSNVVCGRLEDLGEGEWGVFELVTAHHALEHLLDPNQLFRLARRHLRVGGRLLVDVPDAEGRSAGIGNLHIAHVYHFSLATLGNFFVKHGFAIERAKKGSEEPQWTLQVVGRKEEHEPAEWRPPRVDGRAVARSFRHHCVPPLHRRVRGRLWRTLRPGRAGASA